MAGCGRARGLGTGKWHSFECRGLSNTSGHWGARGWSQHWGWEAGWLSAAGQAIVGAAAQASCQLEASPGLGPE